MQPFTDDQKIEIEALVQKAVVDAVPVALHSYFSSKSKTGTQLLFTIASVVIALTAIVGGFKAILGWLGFIYLGK